MNRRVLFLGGVAAGMLLGIATLGVGPAHAGTTYSKSPASSHTLPGGTGGKSSHPAPTSYPKASPTKPCTTPNSVVPAHKTSTVTVPPETTSPSTKAVPAPGGGIAANAVVASVPVQTETLPNTGPNKAGVLTLVGLILIGLGSPLAFLRRRTS